MQLGFIGLGKMGGFMVERLRRENHDLNVFDLSDAAVKTAEGHGAKGQKTLKELVDSLTAPKAVWVMVPAGAPTENTINELAGYMQKGDIIIDGGNSKFTDSIARYNRLKEKGIHFIDVGTSGGVWGLKNGYCMMIGGDKETFTHLEPIFKTLAPPEGYGYMGASGSGHFVKMVHNGIEYGMMQAYAEGFEVMKAQGYDLDLQSISHLWNQGSVVRSWLLELAESALSKDADLSGLKGFVNDSGEGRWTIEAGMAKDVPTPVITAALYARFYSRNPDSFTHKMLAALRNEFGGHAVQKTE
ncbi:MAG: decarboxylating 6-phosphogluconate dehydrogenase [Rhizobacter sp.]|nr:decarboxylating 6-phosphogluconate dehydrogenase [Chlorobiales bacterium]